MHILQDEIRSYDSLHESLNVDTPRVYYSVLLKHCQNMDDLEHGFYLSGDMGMRREDKYITLLLAVSFKNLIKNLDDFISYIFFGPASVSLYAKAVEQLRREMEGKTPPEVEEMSRKFDSYLHVGSWDSPTRWARHANMIWCFDAGMEGIHSGILRLRDTKIVEMLHQWVKTQFSSQKEYKNRKKGLAILVSLSRSADRDNSYFISIFSFLAFILKCTHICGKIHAIENDKDDAKKKEELIRTIKEYFLIKSCRSPEWLMRDKVVKTYNTCHENMTSILEAMQNIPCPTNPEKNYCDAFMDKIADEIIKWHHGNTDKKGNNNAARVEDIYNNNITPHSMGKFWSDLFYCMKSTSYEAEGFKFENYATNSTSWKPQLLQSQVQLYLEGKSDHIDKFAKLVEKIFKDSFKGKPGRLTTFYLGRIKAFPLTDSFIKACEAFQNHVQFGVTNQPKTRNTNIPLNVFQVIQENTIKKALIRALQLPTPSLPQLAQNTLDQIGIINDFIDKLKQAHNTTTVFNLTTTSNHTIISNPTTTSKSSTIGSGNASATGSSIVNGTGNSSSSSIISIPNFTGTSSTTGAINITSAIGNSSSSNTSISNFTGTANITSVTGTGNNSSISNTSIPNFTGTSSVTSGIYTPGFTGFPGATGSVSTTGNTI